MPLSRIAALGISLAVLACSSLRVEPPAARIAAKVEFQDARFDGRYLYGRILVSAAGGPVTLDGRLTSHSAVTVKDVLDCLTNKRTHWLTSIGFPPPPSESDLITLNDGESRGADVKLLVFAEEVIKRPSPDCILATIEVWPSAAGGQKSPLGEVVVRVTKTGEAAADGGSAVDAGALPSALESNIAITPDAGSPDGGAPVLPEVRAAPDAGMVILPSARAESDGGTLTFTDSTGKEIPWPQAVQRVGVLDGPAIVAAHAALEHVLERFPKERAQHCAYSAKAMEVTVGEKDGLYFVNVNHRMDRCGWSEPVSMYLDWFELYAVSPDGRIVARYPYSP